MEGFQIIYIDNIVVVRIDLVSVTLRDAKPLWEEFEKNSLFDHAKIIIDLTSCMHVDSTFIGMIVKIFRRVSNNKGQLKLVFPQLSSIDSFRVTDIERVLECFSNMDEALALLQLKLPLQEFALSEEINRN